MFKQVVRQLLLDPLHMRLVYTSNTKQLLPNNSEIPPGPSIAQEAQLLPSGLYI